LNTGFGKVRDGADGAFDVGNGDGLIHG
jgi:hypothetical protein